MQFMRFTYKFCHHVVGSINCFCCSASCSVYAGAEAASVGQPSLRAAAVRATVVERPFARDPLRVNPPAPRQPVEGRRQSVTVPASRKRKRPEAADPPDGADMSRWRDVKKLCQKAIQHDLSDPEGVDAFSDAAREVVEAFGVNYDDCFGEVYTRHGAPAFFPRIKIIMEVCCICGLLQVSSYSSNAILNAFIMTNGSRSIHLTTSSNCHYNRS